MLIRFAVALSIAAMFAACTKKEISHIGEPPSPVPMVRGSVWYVPPGVGVVPGRLGALEMDGLYPATLVGDKMCCWIGAGARIEAQKPAPASTLDLTVFVPDYAPFRARPQTLSVAIDDSPPDVRTLILGVNVLHYALAQSLRDRTGTIPLRLQTGFTFVPKGENLNADTRRLGLVLSRVDFH